MPLVAIDLFCGAGGLTKGLERAGIRVLAGIDNDSDCEYPFVANTDANYISHDVCDLSPKLLMRQTRGHDLRLLAGCAPCQPFSSYSPGRKDLAKRHLQPLHGFLRQISALTPEFVAMENVPYLGAKAEFEYFCRKLRKLGYIVNHEIVDAAKYGIPQNRSRLILLAGRGVHVEFPAYTHGGRRPERTVEDTIGDLQPLNAGDTHPRDSLHRAQGLTLKNLERIKASRPGGTWKDWPKSLRAKCHQRESGRRSSSIYGRMSWDLPAPTITTNCFNYGSGRFGHPEQDRGISLREAALLQTFPKSYKFIDPHSSYSMTRIGKLIGNAVPVRLGEKLGRAFLKAA